MVLEYIGSITSNIGTYNYVLVEMCCSDFECVYNALIIALIIHLLCA